jgi:hypothetical protein
MVKVQHTVTGYCEIDINDLFEICDRHDFHHNAFPVYYTILLTHSCTFQEFQFAEANVSTVMG